MTPPTTGDREGTGRASPSGSIASRGPSGDPGTARILGILNVTPDSFSDGGCYLDVDAAVAHGLRMASEGADIVDIGGESTRPGAARVPAEEELARVLPVIRALHHAGVVVSIDTMRASTAELAVGAGASIINDVSGGLADSAMAGVAAASGADFVAMHWRGHSADMDSLARYGDVVDDVRRELLRRVDDLIDHGVAPERIILDPGIGFAKSAEHNWELLARLDTFTSLGFRLLIGASRKRFLGALPSRSASAGGDSRDLPTAILTALSAEAGAWGVRVHDIASSRVALDVVGARRRASLLLRDRADTLGDVNRSEAS